MGVLIKLTLLPINNNKCKYLLVKNPKNLNLMILKKHQTQKQNLLKMHIYN